MDRLIDGIGRNKSIAGFISPVLFPVSVTVMHMILTHGTVHRI